MQQQQQQQQQSGGATPSSGSHTPVNPSPLGAVPAGSIGGGGGNNNSNSSTPIRIGSGKHTGGGDSLVPPLGNTASSSHSVPGTPQQQQPQSRLLLWLLLLQLELLWLHRNASSSNFTICSSIAYGRAKMQQARRRRWRWCRRSAINLQIPVAVLLWHATSFLAVELVALTDVFSATLAAHVKQTTQHEETPRRRKRKRWRMLSTTKSKYSKEETEYKTCGLCNLATNVVFFPPLPIRSPPFPLPTNTNCDSLVVYMHNADSAHLYLCKYLSLSNYLYLCMSGLAWFTFRFCASSEKDMFVGKNKQKSPKNFSP